MNNTSKQRINKKIKTPDMLSDYISNIDEPLLLQDTGNTQPILRLQRKTSKGLKKCPICQNNIDIDRFDNHKRICEQPDRRSYQQKSPSPSKAKKQYNNNLIENRKNRIGYKLYDPKNAYQFDF